MAIHKGLGMLDAVTDGVMRDLDAIDPGFPVLTGSIGISHGFVHIVETEIPVDVMGMHMEPEELIHVGRHGALDIPAEVIPNWKGP